MPAEEPLEEAQAVGMAATSAAAKVTETTLRAAQERALRADDTKRRAEHLQDMDRRERARAGGEGQRQAEIVEQDRQRRLDELAQAEQWAAVRQPDRADTFYADREAALAEGGDLDRLRVAEDELLLDWRRSQLVDLQTRQAEQDPEWARHIADVSAATTWAGEERLEQYRRDYDRALSESPARAGQVDAQLLAEWRAAKKGEAEARHRVDVVEAERNVTPERREAYQRDLGQVLVDEPAKVRDVERTLVEEWKAKRPSTEQEMAAAGVAADVREVKLFGDKLNGVDPEVGAKVRRPAKTQVKPRARTSGQASVLDVEVGR